MKIQFIYTFKEKEQEILEYPLQLIPDPEYNLHSVMDILASKDVLAKFALMEFDDQEKNELIKISCCIYLENGPDFDEPQWYKECNGKLWFENGRLQ